MTTSSPRRRKFTGVVVSDSMNKTVVVRVARTNTHPRYGKRFHLSTKFKAHDESNELAVGDKVVIEETRPLSATKRWRVVNKVGSHQPPKDLEV